MIQRIDISPADLEKIQSLTIDHSLLLNDGVDYTGITIRKPWGYEYLSFQNEHVAMWILHINHGSETSLHCHLKKKTSLIVLAGEVICTTFRGETRLTAGEGLLIENGVFHSTRAVSEAGAIVMETETPTNKKDLVRLDDKYGREKKGYEGKEAFMPFVEHKSFHGPEDRFGSPRIIGECSIMIERCEDLGVIHRASASFGADVIGLLKGRLDHAGGILAEPGDVVLPSDLQKNPDLCIVGVAEILLLKKITT
jgi:mannose-6-phosphate isomerase-like protein (cupin superfamily)